MGISGAVFVSSGIGLYRTWYSQFDQSPFHLFDDWTGMSKRGSILYGAACGFVLQGAVEVFDGYSDKWGFSVSDLAANTVGMAAFAVQQAVWDEQRIRFKISSRFSRDYPDAPSLVGSDGSTYVNAVAQRDKDLFGDNGPQRFIKDYNSQTYWMSINLNSFGLDIVPSWLSIALGYGAENLLGGFENTWKIDGVELSYPVQRSRQFYLSPDINWAGIHFDSHLMTTLGTLLNAYKWPTPAVEYDTERGWAFHLLLIH